MTKEEINNYIQKISIQDFLKNRLVIWYDNENQYIRLKFIKDEPIYLGIKIKEEILTKKLLYLSIEHGIRNILYKVVEDCILIKNSIEE